jgi:rhodanese-related sulfurtransferase
MMTISKLLSIIIFLAIILPAFANEGFPGRQKYPNIPYIEIDDFYSGYQQDQYTIIDARSRFEYNVIKIKGAINVPLHSDNFEHDVKFFAKKTGKTLVFYCNGRRCMKSFRAAVASKLSNIRVFDAGVFEWSVAHPDAAVLLQQSPIDPKQLISSEELKSHIIPLHEFEAKIQGSVLIDIRDIKQRAGTGLFLLADRSAPLDNTKRLEHYLNKAINENKTLLAYDNAGKTIRWLQYHLKKKGIKNYFFMSGGAKYYRYDDAKRK